MYIYPLHVLSTENVDTQENDQTYVLLQYLIQVLLLVGLRMLENNQVEPVFIVVPSKCICSYGDAILYMYQLNPVALSSTEFIDVTFHYAYASN
jgi:hypothetical protein